MKGVVKKLIIGAVLGALVLVVMGVYADGRALASSLKSFDTWLLVPILGLTLVNYLLRFSKWHYYLRVVGSSVPTRDSALVFLCGFSMAVTPGKLGELLKAFLLKERCDVPATRTASVVVAERLTDFVALLFLCAGGVLSSQFGVMVLVVASAGSGVFLGVASSERLSLALIGVAGRLPVVGGVAPRLEQMYRAVARLVRPVPLIVATLISVLAWSCECLGFYLVLGGLSGTTPDLGDATFVYAFATIFGAVTMLPGGLGATDGSLIGLALKLGLASSRAAATAAAMLIRFCTLWFAVLVGLLALGVLRRGEAASDAVVVLKPSE